MFFWLLIWLVCWSITGTGIASAQEDSLVTLQIELRDNEGLAVVGEPVVLQRLPEEADIAPACRTDVGGTCAWRVQRGLYQVVFNRPLDAVSTLAVAEGGLRGLGITVGDVTIAAGSFAYHFTFHSDGKVYFDASPEAAVPSPVIPKSDELHSGVAAVAIPPIATDERISVTPTPGSTVTPGEAASASANASWLVLFFIGLGLIIGGVLHLLRSPLRLRSGEIWPRKREQSYQSAKKEAEDA